MVLVVAAVITILVVRDRQQMQNDLRDEFRETLSMSAPLLLADDRTP